MCILKTIDLSKNYHTGKMIVTALSQINLVIEKGEYLSVIGPAKSGKSTLLRLLGGVEIPTSGAVIASGALLSSLDEQQRTIYRRRKMGYIFNTANLLPYLSIEENLAFQLLVDNQPASKYMVRLKSLMALTGLNKVAGKNVRRLSASEQQKVSVVRALLHKPEIILADEPSCGLDESQGREIISLLVGLCRQQEITLVMAHCPSSYISHADQAIFLQEGRVIPGPAVPQTLNPG